VVEFSAEPHITRLRDLGVAGLRLSLSVDVEVTSAADMFTQMRAAYQASRYNELSAPGTKRPRTTVLDILRESGDTRAQVR